MQQAEEEEKEQAEHSQRADLWIVQVVLSPGACMGTALTWRAKPETHANVISSAGLDWDGRIWLNIIAKSLFQMPQWFWKSRKEGFKTNSRLFQRNYRERRRCVRVCEEKVDFARRRDRQEIKMWLTSFKLGLVFTCTHGAGRLCWQIKYTGVQGQTRHTRMIDGSVWMLKSTEHEHVSAAQPRPSTQHLFKGSGASEHTHCATAPIIFSKPALRSKQKGEITSQVLKIWGILLQSSTLELLTTVQNMSS